MTGSNSRKRREAKRERKEPPAYVRDQVPELEKRAQARSGSPGARVIRRADGVAQIVAPHRDDGAWWLGLAEAFGTRSDSVISTFLDQILQLTGDNYRPDQRAINAALGIINAYQPKNEGEAMLAAQMVAAHLLTMKAAGTANRLEDFVPEIEARTFTRLARTFAEQTEVMARLKGRTRAQRIDVHYHQHDNRKAFKADIHLHGGGADFDEQSHGPTGGTDLRKTPGVRTVRPPAIEPPSRSALSGPHQGRGRVSEARDEGQAPMHLPRWLSWAWSALRRAERDV